MLDVDIVLRQTLHFPSWLTLSPLDVASVRLCQSIIVHLFSQHRLCVNAT